MDPYLALGIPRGSTREQVKEAFRSRVHRAHPDRGGDGEAFVELCDAYRQILAELERGDGPIAEAPIVSPRDRVPPAPRDPGGARETYVTWLRQVAKAPVRRQPVRWWRKHPTAAKATLLGLIGLSGALIIWAALTFGPEMPGQAARRVASIGPGKKGRGTGGRPIGTGVTRSPERVEAAPRRARMWEPPADRPRDVFVVPYDATWYITPVGGDATSVTELGVGSSPRDHRRIFRGLPSKPVPSDEVEVGFVAAGSRLRLYLKTGEHWAFSESSIGREAEVVFRDRDDSLGGRGSIVERTGPTTWVLHLDEVDSGDDDDDDLLIGIRLEPVNGPILPE
jgi:hypothetical protein